MRKTEVAQKMKTPVSIAATMVLVAAGSLAVAGPAAGATPRNPCAQPGWSHHPQSGGFLQGPTNIRSGPYLDCQIRGTGVAGQDVTYHCWTSGEGGTWTFLTDENTAVSGWSKDSLLVNNGSDYHC